MYNLENKLLGGLQDFIDFVIPWVFVCSHPLRHLLIQEILPFKLWYENEERKTYHRNLEGLDLLIVGENGADYYNEYQDISKRVYYHRCSVKVVHPHSLVELPDNYDKYIENYPVLSDGL